YAAGNTIAATRDAAGRILSMREPGGRTLSFYYTGDRITSISGPLGTIATYAYDGRGFLSTVTYPDESGYAFTYNDVGQLLSMADHSGRVLQKNTYEKEKVVSAEAGGGKARRTYTYGEFSTTVK